jgi:hypothetical protein
MTPNFFTIKLKKLGVTQFIEYNEVNTEIDEEDFKYYNRKMLYSGIKQVREITTKRGDPIKKFINKQYILDKNAVILKSEVVDGYNSYSNEQRSVRWMSIQLREKFEVIPYQIFVDSKTVQVYKGLKSKHQENKKLDLVKIFINKKYILDRNSVVLKSEVVDGYNSYSNEQRSVRWMSIQLREKFGVIPYQVSINRGTKQVYKGLKSKHYRK